MQKTPSIVDILYRYQRQEPLSEPDKRILEDWLRASEANQDLFDDISNEEEWNRKLEELRAKDSRATWNLIRERIEAMEEKPVARIFPWKKWVAVAAIFAGAVAGTYLLVKNHNGVIAVREETQEERYKNDVMEAIPQPTLTLPDGEVIRLDKAATGKLNGANSIWKTDSNTLLVDERAPQPEEKFNTLTTPIGAQFSLTLSDGSKVWLNAGSSLQFTTSFAGPQRKVILVGEAYFEIARNAAKAFIVEAGSSTTRVIGTHFNVRSYPTESTTTTTLLEGLVRFRAGADSIALRPGQQASLWHTGRISVDSANVQASVAWRENLFWFESETFEQIMDELSRWYPIRVHYQGRVPQKFSGILPRSRSLIEVLKTLELAGYVQFRINGNEVDVIPRKTETESP